MEYTLNVSLPGRYTFTLSSTNSRTYDPYLRLLLDGRVIAEDDDSAGNRNSRIIVTMNPGTYTVRVTSYRRSQVSAPVNFSLGVRGP